jgi:hypothetical protein
MFWPRAGWLVPGTAWRSCALPQGRYDYPDWLFFGGAVIV